MTEFVSKTIRLAFVFAAIAGIFIPLDAAYFQATGDHLQFVIEYFSLLGIMFTAITAKNATDNFLSYRRDTIQYQATGQLPVAPVKQ